MEPTGAVLAAIFFGLAFRPWSVIVFPFQLLGTIPSVYLQIAIYVITIIVLIGFVGQLQGARSRWDNLY